MLLVHRQGITMQDLKHKVQEAEREEKRQLHERAASKNTSLGKIKPADEGEHSTPSTARKERKDSSPVRVSHHRVIFG